MKKLFSDHEKPVKREMRAYNQRLGNVVNEEK